jgi:hypothetical protein
MKKQKNVDQWRKVQRLNGTLILCTLAARQVNLLFTLWVLLVIVDALITSMENIPVIFYSSGAVGDCNQQNVCISKLVKN